jgi:predicted N-acetyltransferase YhbS
VQTHSLTNWTISYRFDHAITEVEDANLRRLLFSCFPYEPALLTRRYLREAPAHRWLVYDESQLIAHAGLHDKTIGTQAGPFRIGGVSEICVLPKYRNLGLVKQLLQGIHEWAEAAGLPFTMLFGQPKVYSSSGYTLIQNPLRMENSVTRQWNPFCGKPMIRKLSAQEWPSGLIDLRGPTF